MLPTCVWIIAQDERPNHRTIDRPRPRRRGPGKHETRHRHNGHRHGENHKATLK
jgi:hypothetical protein